MAPSQGFSAIIVCGSEMVSRILSRYFFKSVFELGMTAVMSVNR